jgi:hypothetical protein
MEIASFSGHGRLQVWMQIPDVGVGGMMQSFATRHRSFPFVKLFGGFGVGANPRFNSPDQATACLHQFTPG